MAKNKNRTSSKATISNEPKQETLVNHFPMTGNWLPGWLSGFKIQAAIVALLAIIFYANTFKNESALDDYMVIVKNEYVYQGVAGLPDIFTKDAYYSYFKHLNTSNQLSGGRYRPLSIATFAIEQQFFGTIAKNKLDSVIHHTDWGETQAHPDKHFLHNMHIRHIVNVVLFALSIIVLLYFLRYIVFKNNLLMALVATILFAIHPIHTEVVANVKSRDELLSLLFICLTFIFAFKYQEQKEKKWLLYAGLFSYLLAFLSKEYAIGLVLLLPLSFFLFNKYSLSKSIVATLPYIGVVALYSIIRLQAIGQVSVESASDILTDPYALATASEKIATQIATPLNYFRLLIFPHPLSADYSYNAIPYKDFSSPWVWLSLVVHIALVRLFFYYLKKNIVLSFAIAFYLVNLILICNLLFNTGGTMGERLIYHSSVGFVIGVAYLLVKGAQLVKPALTGKMALTGCVLLLIVASGFKTMDRNADWKNDVTLFTHDIKVVPNSILANGNVAGYLIINSDLEKDSKAKNDDLVKAIELLDKTLLVNKNNPTTYFNKCVAYNKLNVPDSIESSLNALHNVYPNYPQIPQIYFIAGMSYLTTRKYDKARVVFQNLLRANPGNAELQGALKAVDDSIRGK